MFAAGIPDGHGRLLARTGEIFEGEFRDGLKQGMGKTRLAGGTIYESQWDHGKEIGAKRPDALADATVGGLLKAQSGGGDAGKVDIGIVVDERMTQQSDMQYQHLVRDEDIAIYPVAEDMNAAWNGTGEITAYSGSFDGMDWENAPAFVDVDVGTTDGSRVKFDSLQLQVQASDAYRKPMLSLVGHQGCVGFRPSFSFKNNGWGDVRDASISVQFTGENPDDGQRPRAASPSRSAVSATALTFSSTTCIAQAGVDTQKLASERFSCQSMDSIGVCKSQVFNSVGFGEIADFVWGDQKLMTTAKGSLSYSWADDQRQCLPGDRAVQGRHLAGGDRGAERTRRMRRRVWRIAGGAALPGRQAADQPARLFRRPADARQQEPGELYRAPEDVVGDVVVPPVPGGRQIRRRQRAALEDREPVLLPAETIRLRFDGRAAACYLKPDAEVLRHADVAGA